MKDGGKVPEPDETLDAPVNEPPKSKRGLFIWLSVVVLALGIWSAASFLSDARVGPSQKARTASRVYDLMLACENFRLNNGKCPWPKPNEVTATTEISGQDVYIELRALPGAKVNTNQDYLGEARKGSLKNGALVDTWGHEIKFRINPNGLQVVIWSCGPNGIDETNDDDSPDPAKYPKGYYWFGKGDTGDDITTLRGIYRIGTDAKGE